MTRRRKPDFSREADIQEYVAALLDEMGLTWKHVPNGGKRDKRSAAILKRQGVKDGVFDIEILDTPITGEKGLALELKTLTGTMSPGQKEWLAKYKAAGWRTEVAYGVHDAARIIRECYPIARFDASIEVEKEEQGGTP